jgi:hypothetical protein
LGIVRQAADEGCEKRIFRSIKGEVPHRAGHDQHVIEIVDHRSGAERLLGRRGIDRAL